MKKMILSCLFFIAGNVSAGELRPVPAGNIVDSTTTITNCLRVPATGNDLIAGPCVNDRVGISTSVPAYLLDVQGDGNFKGQNIVGGSQTLKGIGDHYNEVYFRRSSNLLRVSTISMEGGNFDIKASQSGNFNLTFYTANTERMRVDSAGNVGVGTISPCSTCTIHVVGNVAVMGSILQRTALSCATGVTTDATGKLDGCVASDGAFKTGVEPLADSGKIVDGLRPVYYNWKKDYKDDGRQHVGFIAQQVESQIPQAVVSAGSNARGIDSNALIAVLVKEIQSLRVRLNQLEASRRK